jgi:hypothetical protein
MAAPSQELRPVADGVRLLPALAPGWDLGADSHQSEGEGAGDGGQEGHAQRSHHR